MSAGDPPLRARSVWGARLSFVAALLAAVSSASPDRSSYEVLESMPGPYFRLGPSIAIVDWLVSVRTHPSALPTDGEVSELFEVELDAKLVEPYDTAPTYLFVRLARVADDGMSVLSSTVAQVQLTPVGTVRVADEQGRSVCGPMGCDRRYVVRFVVLGPGRVETQWLIQAGVDWWGRDPEMPPEATIGFDVVPL